MKEEYPNNNFGRFFDSHPDFAKAVGIYSGKFAINYLQHDKALMKKYMKLQEKHHDTKHIKYSKNTIHYESNKIKRIDPKKAYSDASINPLSNNNNKLDMNYIDPLSGKELEANIDLFMKNNRKLFTYQDQIYHFQKNVHRNDLTASEAITDANSHILHINHQLKQQHLPKNYQTNNVSKLKQYMNSPQITYATASQLAHKRIYSKIRNQANYAEVHGNLNNTLHFATRTDIKLKVNHSVHSQMHNLMHQQNNLGKHSKREHQQKHKNSLATDINKIQLGTHALNQVINSMKQSHHSDTLQNHNKNIRTKHRLAKTHTSYSKIQPHIKHHTHGLDIG